jgi:hypothetical protein
MAVPDEFSAEATRMPVGNIGNGSGKKEIDFGGYQSSRIKRGWNITSSRYDRNTRVSTEERVLRAFGIDKNNITTNQKDKFQFTLQKDNGWAEIYAMERQVTEETRVLTGTRLLGDIGMLKNAQYSFSAAIITGVEEKDQWDLVIYSSKDPHKNKDKNIFERNAWEGSGLMTNGIDSFVIRTVEIDKVVSQNGKQSTMPFPLFRAYEFRADDAVSAIVDTFGKNIWMYNELDEKTRLVIAAASAAILLRRIGNF